MEKQKNIPQLRFPEFKGEWGRKLLGEVTMINPTTKKLPERFIYIDLESVSEGELTKEAVFLKKNAPSRAQRFLTKDDILFQTVRPYQKNNLYFDRDGDCVASTGYAQIKTKQIPRFIYQYLHLQRFVDDVIEKCTGTSYPAINSKDLAKINIIIPSLPEQQKIASFFTAIDQKISQLKQKKTLLEQYKKGLMQKIFSQELRFKDDKGKEFPKWEKKKLGDVAEVKRGAASNHLKYVNDKSKGVRLLRINDFLNDDAVYVEDTNDIKRFRVRTNDLLIAGTGATAGIIFIVPEKFNDFSFSYNAPRIRVTNAFHTYIYYYLKSDIILKEQKRLFVGNAQAFLDTDAMRGFKINLPSYVEQTKIANFLSAIDDKIYHCQKQIDKAEVWKKGLLQKMFV